MSSHNATPRTRTLPQPAAVFVVLACMVAFAAIMFGAYRMADARTYINLTPEELADIEAQTVGKMPSEFSSDMKQLFVEAATPSATAGSISVAKVVKDSADGLAPAADASFTFTLGLTKADGTADATTYLAFEMSENGYILDTLNVTDGSTFNLSNGQHLFVSNVPNGETYTVSETANPDYVTTATGEAGTVANGATSSAVFTNTYNPKTVTLDGAQNLAVTKELAGRAWNGASFDFKITPADPANPMPSSDTVTLSSDTGAAGSSVAGAFGDIVYDAAGEYVYTISEVQPADPEAGITYSAAVYELDVTVTAAADGTLTATSTLAQTKTDTGVEITALSVSSGVASFVNTYDQGAVAISPVGEKLYTDPSGATTLASGAFSFQVSAYSDNNPPMPSKTVFTNSGSQIVFEPVIYTQPGVYQYKIEELEPQNASSALSIDKTPVIATVTVAEKDGALAASVAYATESGEALDSCSFANSYQPTAATLDLSVKKVLTGRSLTGSEHFDFSVTTSDPVTQTAIQAGQITGVTAPGSATQLTPAQALNSGIASASVYGLVDGVAQTVDLSTITFTHVGTYVFQIGEIKGSLWAVNYDQGPIDVTVVVTEKDGALVATPTYSSSGGHSTTTFTNKYDATPAVATVDLEKVFTGRAWTDSDQFQATITTQDPYSPLPTNSTVTFTKDAQTGSFEIPFTVAGQYFYQIAEKDLGATNVTYDKTVWNIRVDVTEGEDNKLVATVVYDTQDTSVDKVTFKNTYALNPVELQLSTTKILTGRDMLAGETFDFTVTPDMDDAATVSALEAGTIIPDADASGVSSSNAAVTADTVVAVASVSGLKDGVKGTVTFSSIGFSATGTYKFWLQEVAGTRADVTYDTHKELVTVTVTENGVAYIATPVYSSSEHGGLNEYVNTYDAAPVVVNGQDASQSIRVGKMLTGRDATAGEAFTFTLTPENLPSDATAALNQTQTLTIDAGADGELVDGSFTTPMSFSQPGTYVYQLTEDVPSDTGDVTYDTTTWFVKIEVAVSDTTGALEATIEYSSDGGATYSSTMPVFINKAKTAGASYTFTVAKVLEGRSWLATDKFTVDIVPQGDAPAPTRESVTILDTNNPVASFGTATFTKAGEYEYVIKEVVPDESDQIPGITYDTTEHVVVVQVEEKNGALEVVDVASKDDDFDANGSVKITNTYSPEPLVVDPATEGEGNSISLYATKTLHGIDQGDEAFAIDYNVEGYPTGAKVTGDTTGTCSLTDLVSEQSQTIRFDNPVTVYTPGTYSVKVTESIPADALGLKSGNITYDDTVYYAVITVADDYATGKLTATVVYTNEDGSVITPHTDTNGAVVSQYPSFNNWYTPEPVTQTFTIKKDLTGRSWFDSDAFVVKIVPQSTSNPMPDTDTVTFTKDKPVVETGAISFTKPGVYKYYLEEQADSLGEGTSIMQGYDKIGVTVTVTTDTETGDLVAETAYDGTNGIPWATIFNTYKAEPVTVTGLKSTKALTGRAWKDTDQFTFDLVFSSVSTSGTLSYTLPTGTTEELMATATIDDKTPEFGPLTLTQAGTYTYLVYEVVPETGIPGITYCENLIDTVTIDVTDPGDGKLVATYTYQNMDYENLPAGQVPVFTNEYAPTPITESIDVTKTLSGIDWTDGTTFSATISAQTAGAPLPEQTTIAFTSDDVLDSSDGVSTTKPVAFGPIEFTEGGTYYYTIKEDAGANGNMTYDAAEYTVKVVVTDDTNTATLSATVSYPDATSVAVPLTNTYKPVAVSMDSGAAATPDLETGAGLSEGAPDGAGTKRVYASGINVEVEKTLTGRDELSGEKFTFTLTPDTFTQGADAPTPVTVPEGDDVTSIFDGNATIEGTDGAAYDTVELTGLKDGVAGSVAFAHPITFYNTGTYTFTIREAAANPVVAGTTYSDAVYKLTVTVVNDKTTGLLVASESLERVGSDGATTPADAAAFENTYVPSPDTLDASAVRAAKILDGSEACATRAFTIKLAPTAETAATGDVTMTNADGAAADALETTVTVGSGQMGSTVTAGFDGTITFAKAGVYTFEETEVVPDATDGVTYDMSVKTVTITVAEDEKTGMLVASVAYGAGAATEPEPFTNTYKATAATAAPQATKELAGRDWNDDDAFTFELTDPATGAVVATARATADEKTVTFEGLTFDKAGSYTYDLTEVRGSEPGMDYDATTHTVTIEVVDDGTGALEATVLYDLKGAGPTSDEYALFSAVPVFTNTYESSVRFSDAASVSADKTLDGAASTAGEFTFELTPSDEASAKLLGATAFTNNAGAAGETVAITTADGETLAQVLGSIDFTNAEAGDTYAWMLKETGEAGAGYTLDETVHTIEVKVSTDGAGATLLSVYVDGSEVGASGAAGNATISFVNTYAASTQEGVGIRATKELEGETLSAGEFTFTLTDAKGDVVAEATNAADGSISFPSLSYTWQECLDAMDDGNAVATIVDGKDAAKFTYTVAEDTSGLEDGYTATRKGFTVTVTVVNEGDGTLSTSVAYPADTTLRNVYSTNDAYVYITGRKVVTCEGKNLTAPDVTGKYTFTLAAEDGAPLPASATATNDASGTVEFGPIEYTLDDLDGAESKTFTYEVSESGDVPGVANDDSTYKVQVAVTNDGDGKLTATVLGAAGVADFTFTNVYSVVPVQSVNHATPDAGTVGGTSVAVGLAKSLKGRDLKAGEFTFEMIDHDGNVVAIGTNAADGIISMGEITFDSPGTYTYTLREAKGDEPGVVYDTKQYTATAVVTNNGNGTLSVAWSIAGAQFGSDLVFYNSYEPAPASATVVASKVFENDTLTGGEFTFELVDTDGNVVATAKNTAQGGVAFEPLTFSAAGTYTYTLREVKGDLPGVTYDGASIGVTVTVTNDDAAGKLVATVAYDPAATFTNTYAAKPVSVALEATKTLDGKDLEQGEFTFQVKDAAGAVVATATNEADGSVTFAPIEFTAPGTYTYTIAEVAGDDARVAYDARVVTATVTVTNDYATGSLVADVSYSPEATFANTFTPAAAEATIEATKTLDGRDLAKGEFTFELVDAEGNVVATAVNGADGSVVFGPMTWDKAGTYTYTMREVAGEAAGVTYDTRGIGVTVTVTNDMAGALKAEVSYDGEAVFTNVYAAPAAKAANETPEPAASQAASAPENAGNAAGTAATTTVAPKTGDDTSFTPAAIAVVLGVGLVGAAAALVRKKRK